MNGPAAAAALYDRALAHQNKGDFDRAIGDYDKTIALDPNYALAYNNRGKACQAKGDRAAADFREANRLDLKLGAK